MFHIAWKRLFPYRIVRVRGHSMSPTLHDGDVVLVRLQAFKGQPPRKGEIVLTRHPFRRDVRLIKRVVEVAPGGRVMLAGDNPRQSHDSRGFGTLPLDYIRGRVVRVLKHAPKDHPEAS